ncbi:MAG: YfhO family protein [Candidatus Aureabacteria bacterium]|nr:YfhO family protein [Candidatus Auribacterota bacterium]
MPKYKTGLVILFLCALPYALLFPAIFGTKVILFPDHLSFFYPYKYVASQMYRECRMHLWDPYIFAGLPMGAEIQTGLFYPLNFFFLALPVFKAIAQFAAFHLFLASLFMYLYLRGIALSRSSSLFGALVFAYNGFSFVHTEQLSIISTCAWLPLILLLIERASRARGVVYPVLAGIAMGSQFLAGHPQMALINVLAIAAYVIFLLHTSSLSGRRAGTKRLAITAILITALGLSLASIALIPFAEVYPFSLRAHAGADPSTDIALAPGRLHTLLLPQLRPKAEELDEVTGSVYAGTVPFLLAILAAAMLKKRLVRFYSLLALLSLLAAFGRATPLWRVFSLLAPFRLAFQIPLRFLFPYMLSISALSAIALDSIPEIRERIAIAARCLWVIIAVLIALTILLLLSPGTRDFLVHSTVGGVRAPVKCILMLSACALLFHLWARGRITRVLLVISLTCLTLADLLPFDYGYLKFGDESIALAKPEVFNFFERDKSLYRVSILDRDIGLNLPMVYKIQNVSGYSPVILSDTLHYSIYNATHSHDLSRVQSVSRFYLLPNLDTKMSGLMNIKYHVAPFMKEGVRYMGISQMKKIYPRAFLVPRYTVVPERNAILEILGNEEFDPTKVILLETDAGLENYNFMPSTGGEAQVIYFAPDRIDIATRAETDSLLFVSEIFFPGWRVFIDGIEGRIYRANFIFRSVPLRRGEHRVSFIYDPLSFRVGKYISISSLALCLCLLTWGMRRRSQRDAQAP